MWLIKPNEPWPEIPFSQIVTRGINGCKTEGLLPTHLLVGIDAKRELEKTLYSFRTNLLDNSIKKDYESTYMGLKIRWLTTNGLEILCDGVAS